MKNKLKLNFTEINNISVLKEDYIKKYLDENSHFDTKKFNEELNELSKSDLNEIRNLFINCKNIGDLLSLLRHYIIISERQENIFLMWSDMYQNQVESDMRIIEENLELNISGFETDFRKKDSYHHFMLTNSLCQFFQKIKFEISEIQNHFTDISEKTPTEKPKDHYVENDDFVYAFLQVCKSHKIFNIKGNEKEVPDSVILDPILDTFDFKKPKKLEFYSSETVRQNFVSKRTNNGKNERYKQYVKKITDVLNSVS